MIKQALLLTAVAFNLMLGSLLITKKMIKIDSINPVISTPYEDTIRIDYVIEYTGIDRLKESRSSILHDGTWIVEHYKEYEYHYNNKGEVIYKKPTSKEETIRYWADKNTHPY